MSGPTTITQPRTHNRVQTPVSPKRQLNNSISAQETVVASRGLWLQTTSSLDVLVYQLYGHCFRNTLMTVAFIVLIYAFKDQIASEVTKLIKKSVRLTLCICLRCLPKRSASDAWHKQICLEPAIEPNE